MKMKKILSIILVMVLLASAVPLAITPAAAIYEVYEKKLPCDADENDELTQDELVAAILPYMLGEGDLLNLDDVGDASYVYAYWDGKPKTIVDANEEVSIFYRPPERIVAAYGHIYMPLQILHAVDRIVGYRPSSTTDDITYDILYPAFRDIPSVGAGWVIDYELLLKVQPDLLFIRPAKIGGAGGKDNHYKRVREIAPDLPVVRLSLYKSYDITTYVGELRTLGHLLDKEEEAEEFIDYYEGFLNVIDEKVSDLPEEDKLRVYYEGRGRYKTGVSGSALDWLIVSAGGKNIFADNIGSQVTAEDVIKLDPEVIFKSAGGGGYEIDDITAFKNARDEIMNRHGLQNVTAVKTGRVYVISQTFDCCGARGGRYFLAIPYIAKSLYPDIDLDPTALHQEFLTEFQEGVNFDSDEHGLFCYHPERFPEGR